MAKFEKGNPGKPKGAKNKSTQLMRDRIQSLFDDNFDKIQEDLEALEAKDRLKFLTDLMPYLMPKLQSTTYSQKIDLDSMEEAELDILINHIINE
ncbi:hypothetical protein LV84_03467 [Algoriphagus ratkowskyi]|uniref:Uncharacterized protein n=1 Tax=Algoriphagus ratkowskyi TaxID=57028 RepID=A0A2W7QX02_9BACT|nr:hypothetical protein [Algoriphagus ratkowskyi]PZX52461.1 hypothetical protein LV84_03467 [Algoriphagus ratkowskyi]TXD76194.1 hypothetical protein ESW18_17335 [Algoriphagus ratkowskyi]